MRIDLNNKQIRFLHKIQKLRYDDKLNTGYNKFIERVLKNEYYSDSDKSVFFMVLGCKPASSLLIIGS